MAETWTVMRALTWTAKAFGERGIQSARLDAELLLAHAMGLRRLDLYLQHDKPLSPDERDRFRDLVKRRAAGEPTQYITGAQEFWSMPLEVTPAVLIPRGDTEVLVERALELLRAEGAPERPRIADVGTGSGAIALALAKELPEAVVVGIDVSQKALEVARRNVERHAMAERVKLVCGRLLEPVLEPPGRLDLVVSNPPYVRTDEIPRLMREVGQFEPKLALDGGPDGLAVYRPLVQQALRALAAGGWLALEVGGAEQADEVRALLEAAGGWEDIRAHRDYAGQTRVVTATRIPAKAPGPAVSPQR